MNNAKFVKEIRTEWVKEWTIELLSGLEKQVTKTEIETYCKDKLEEFSKLCEEKAIARAKQTGKDESTVNWKKSATSNLSGVRYAIGLWSREQEGTEENSYEVPTKDGIVLGHKALLYINYGRDFLNETKAKGDAKKQAQRRNLTPITDVSAYQSAIELACLSNEWRDLTVGIQAALGTRLGETLLTAEIKQISQFQVQFTGQIKTKDEERESYPKYTLIESAKVVDALLKLRRMAENKELRNSLLTEVDSQKNSTVNRKVREIFGDLLQPPYGVEDISTHKLRSAHAAIAFYLFGSWSQSFGSFIKDNLGHKGDGEAASYEDYQVTDKDGKPLTQGAWLNRLNEEITEPTLIMVQPRIRMTKACYEATNDQNFLPFPDQVSRFEELLRLAKIGKQFEVGELKNEVVIIQEVEVIKEVPVPTQTATMRSEETTNATIETDTKKEPKRKDVSEIPTSALIGSNTPYSGNEKLKRAIAAIKEYNERQPSKEQRWSITSSVLQTLTGCRTALLKSYMDSGEGRINIHDYNQLHGFTYHHNKGKGSIKDVIKFQ